MRCAATAKRQHQRPFDTARPRDPTQNEKVPSRALDILASVISSRPPQPTTRAVLLQTGTAFGNLCPCLSLACFAVSVLGSSPALAVSGAELIRGEHLRYGRFEARMRFAPGDGVVSSFFLWKDGSERPDVFWNEIDIEKLGLECNGYASNALYGLPQTNHSQDIPSNDNLCTAYHTHAVEWTPDHLSWLLDGREVRRITGGDLQAFEQNAFPGMQMRFNLWVGNNDFGGNFSAETLPVHQFINWVSYAAYTPGAGPGGTDFTEVFRDDFDAALDAGWSLANWVSPLNNSVHSPTNVRVVDGKVVLSLTADNALGFFGTPPVDPADFVQPDPPPQPTEPQSEPTEPQGEPTDTPPATPSMAGEAPDVAPDGVIGALMPDLDDTQGDMAGGETVDPDSDEVAMEGIADGAPLPPSGAAMAPPTTAMVVRASGSNGGCSVTTSAGSTPVLPGLILLSTIGVWLGRRRQRQAPPPAR
jgi:endo-1,3-1,4-beta-glycanase ExoK